MASDFILVSPIEKLPLSESFCRQTELMGFKNLKQIVETPADTLMSKEGFNFGWLGELSKFLSNNGLLYKLQPLPGTVRQP